MRQFRSKFALFLLLCSCRTITQPRGEFNIPDSTVYFSFDDGPNAQTDTTARLLDTLKKYQIRALFCLLGENAEQYPDLVRRMYDEGHCIANHGYSDKWAKRMDNDEFRDNLVRSEAAISAAIGHDMYPKLYRPHGGFYSPAQERIMRDEGYVLVPSTVRVYDAVLDGTKQRKVVRKIVKKVEKRGGGIVLLHDARDSQARTEESLAKKKRSVYDRSWIPDAMEEIIPVLLDRGYILNGPDILTVIGAAAIPSIDKK